MPDHQGHERTIRLLRRALLGLAAASVVATAVELAMERHWQTKIQLVPWFTLAVLGLAIAAVAMRPDHGALISVARVVAALVLVVAAFGIFEHVRENHDAGPLNRHYSATWDTRSAASQWWLAATKRVGPAPPLAPAVLAESALALLLATVGAATRQPKPIAANPRR